MSVSDLLRRKSTESRMEDTSATLERIKNLKRRAATAVNELYKSVLDVEGYANTGEADLFKKRRSSNGERLEGYLDRIKTFTSSGWGDKSSELSATYAALHGWKCHGKGILKCVGCDRVLSTVLPRITSVSIQVYKKCLRHARDQLTSAHELTCPYRNGTIDFFHNWTSAAQVRHHLRGYFKNLQGIDVRNVQVDDSEFASTVISDVFGEELLETDHKIARFAIAHWDAVVDTDLNTKCLHCKLCNRTILPKCLDGIVQPSILHRMDCPVLSEDPLTGLPMWSSLLGLFEHSSTSISQKINHARNTFVRAIYDSPTMAEPSSDKMSTADADGIGKQ